jgi:hypothetical protein
MEELRLQAVPSRVAAWHNQHPLAHRITPEQVQAVGYLALPVEGDETLGPMAPLSPRRVARWAARHGRVLAQAPAAAAEVSSSTSDTSASKLVYAMTATIELGGLRTRVLMGAGTPGAVLGPRLWSGPRLAAGAALWAVLMSLLVGLAWLLPAARHVEPVAAASVASVAKPAVTGAISAPKATVLAVAAPASVAVAASTPDTPAVAAAAPVLAPVDLPPQSGRVALPALSAMISDDAKAAARAQRQSRASAAPASAPVHSAEVAVGKTPAPVAAQNFALSTRPLRTRAEAEQVQAAMSALLRSGTAGKLGKVQTDILPEGDDWRVVGLPFAQRDVAEQARRVLEARGMRVQVVAF